MKITTNQFAAFIITYNRPEIIGNTIAKINEQSFPPKKILVVDNSESDVTKEAIEKLGYENLEYYRVGYNSGPAGGSKIGLEKLSAEGYDWIYWGDDNNPPRDETVFRRFFECIEELQLAGESIGMFCGKGGKLNKITGRIRSMSNQELEGKEIAEIDVVAGGQTLLVNAEIVKKGILPDANLFFSFEDLDMSLKAGNNGFKSYTDAKTWLEIRKKYGDIRTDYRPSGSSFGDQTKLHRNFYSLRNLLIIYWRNQLIFAVIFLLFKSLMKMLVSFKFGYRYGLKNLKLFGAAIKQFLKGKPKNILNVIED